MCVSHGPVTRPLRRAGYFRAGGLGPTLDSRKHSLHLMTGIIEANHSSGWPMQHG